MSAALLTPASGMVSCTKLMPSAGLDGISRQKVSRRSNDHGDQRFSCVQGEGEGFTILGEPNLGGRSIPNGIQCEKDTALASGAQAESNLGLIRVWGGQNSAQP